MRILSLNVRGLGSLAKQKILRYLLSSLSLNVVLLQETMTSPYPALYAFYKLCTGWEFCALSSNGLSGGILSGWNPKIIKCKSFHTVSGILLKASVMGIFPKPLNYKLLWSLP